MIEKLPVSAPFGVQDDWRNKINELVDAVNELHEEAKSNARTRADHEHKIEELQKDREEIKEWIGIVSDLSSRVPVVESRVSILEEHAHPTAKAPVDPFAEQRKWIGKVCRFRDEHYKPDCWEYGVLKDIEDVDTAIASAFRSSDGYWYDICEPVKPDDDIIYKGGDND